MENNDFLTIKNLTIMTGLTGKLGKHRYDARDFRTSQASNVNDWANLTRPVTII